MMDDQEPVVEAEDLDALLLEVRAKALLVGGITERDQRRLAETRARLERQVLRERYGPFDDVYAEVHGQRWRARRAPRREG